MGGGGANSLDSLKTAENSDFDNAQNDADLSDNEEETITEYTYKTFDDYYTDYNITADTITENDLVGNGSLSDPYVVQSTNGFLYLMNYPICKKNLVDKYVKLACDIVLNDETFDENGNPSGGDGVVYSWESSFSDSTRAIFFNGNGHFVSGMYYSNEEGQYAGLFGNQTQNLVQNLTITNYFLKAKQSVGAFGRYISKVTNCVAKNGFIYANALAAGITCSSSEITNTKHYSKVVVTDRVVGGFIASWASTSTTIIKNCENYGEIIGLYYVAGIVGTPSAYVTVIDCKNFGTIRGTSDVAGICSADYYIGAKKFINCTNYGFIDVDGGVNSAGILGWATQNTMISNCAQYGDIYIGSNGFYSGGLVGTIGDGANVTISDCKVDFYYEGDCAVLVGRVHSGSRLTMTKILAQTTKGGSTATIFEYIEDSEVFLEGMEVDVKLMQDGGSVYFVRYFQDGNDFQLNNALIRSNAQNYFLTRSNVQEMKINSIILGENYYGSNFSGYFINWKTGKIGVRALSGKDLYQGRVTESVLQERGYVKMSV